MPLIMSNKPDHLIRIPPNSLVQNLIEEKSIYFLTFEKSDSFGVSKLSELENSEINSLA